MKYLALIGMVSGLANMVGRNCLGDVFIHTSLGH